jgi:5-methylcytosine-specific restriction endonuclease McrA
MRYFFISWSLYFVMVGHSSLGFSSKDIDIMGGHRSTKRKPIGRSLRHQVWLKYMHKKAEGKCYCCRIRTIHVTDFQVGHNKAVAKGGKDHISNLRPICGVCNRGMGTKSVEWYKKKYFAKPKPKKKTVKKKTTKRKSNNPLDFKIPKFDFKI